MDRSDYIVYGWKLPYEIKDKNDQILDFWSEKFIPYIEGRPGVEYTIIRGEEYTVFGILIKKDSEECYIGWEFVDLKIDNLDSNETKIKFLELFEIEPTEEPKLFIFSNFS